MKFIKIIPLLISLLFISCNNESLVAPINLTATNVAEISGKLKDWNYGTGKSVFFLGYTSYFNDSSYYSSSPIESTGKFQLIELEIPSDEVYYFNLVPELSDQVDIITNTLTCTDSSAKFTTGDLYIIEDSSMSIKGHIQRKNYQHVNPDEDPYSNGDFYVNYICVNRDANLTGSFEYKYVDSYVPIINQIKTNYNLSLKKGWNKSVTSIVYYSEKEENDTTYIKIEYNILNYEPSKADWYFEYSE